MPESFGRRVFLGLSGALGISVALPAAAGASGRTLDAEPDPAGGFGRPPAADALRLQMLGDRRIARSSTSLRPGVVTDPYPGDGADSQVRPSPTPLDTTALSRRAARWPVEG